MLLLISATFYILANLSSPLSIVLMAAAVTATYFAGLFVAPRGQGDALSRRRRALAAVGVLVALTLLVALRIVAQVTTSEYFPLGAAIWLLHCVSYIIDIARGDVAPGHPLDSLLYLTCFPLLIIGPVVRYKVFLRALEQMSCSVNRIADGMRSFAVGFVEQIAVSAVLLDAYDRILSNGVGSLNLTLGLCAAVLIFVISFFSLSGLSCMAHGLALMFGLDFDEDVGSMLTARTPGEYFSRCFLGLGLWLDDYLCSPLLKRCGRSTDGRLAGALRGGLGVVWLAVWLKCSPSLLLTALAVGVIVALLILSGADRAILRHRPLWPLGWLLVFCIATVFWTSGIAGSPAALLRLAGSLTVSTSDLSIYYIYIEVSGGRYLASLGIALLMIPMYHRYRAVASLLPRGLRSVYDGVCTVIILGLFAFSLLFYLPQYPEYALRALKHFSF